MKTQTVCAQCLSLAIESRNEPETLYIQITEENPITFTCGAGHVTHWLLDLEHFEILFEFGLRALKHDFNREAVMNFASAIERFHETIIRILCIEMGIDLKTFKVFWNSIAVQSERQFGAFQLLITMFTKENQINIYDSELKFRKKTKSMSKFRNDIAHNGMIPSPSEVEAYAEAAFNYMKMITILIKNKAPSAFENYRMQLLEAHSVMHKNPNILIGGVQSRIGFRSEQLESLSFQELLDEVKSSNTRKYF